MDSFRFDINETLYDCMNLSRAEAGLYIEMISRYYINEEPFPSDFDRLCMMFNCRSKTDKKMLQKITELKFLEKDGLLHHKKADEEIKKHKQKCETNKKNGSQPKKSYSQS